MNSSLLKSGNILLYSGMLIVPVVSPAQPQQDDAPVIQEVIVTAQKREQSLQSLGVTMSALSAAELDARNYRDLAESTAAISNVELFEDYPSAGLPTWIIRGVGLQDFNTNNTPTASVFTDEIYQSSVVMGGAGLFDVEQLEIMKGPQGGLYGRNTTGGAVLLNTRRARLGEQSGSVGVHYGSWSDAGIEGTFNVPLSDRLAWRVAGRILSRDDAWQRSIPGNREHGEQERWDLRSWLNFAATENLSIEWKVQAGADDSEIDLARAVGLYSATGGFCGSMLAGRRDDTSCLSWAGFNQLVQLQPNTNEVASQAMDGSLVLSEPLNQQSNDYLSSLLHISGKIGDLELLSITGIDQFDYGVSLDLDASDGEFAHRLSSSDIELLSQEFRVQSDDDNGLSWMLGLSLSEERFEERRQFLFRDNFLVIASMGLSFGNVDYDQDTSSQALYGNIRYAFQEDWNLNLSLRYTNEDKEYRNGQVYVPGPVPFYVYNNLSRDYSLDDHWSGNIGLEWTPQENLLIYASVADAYKSGGFYGGFPSFPQEIDPYQEETIIAYELGFKSDPASSLRLNGAVFYYDYTDVQGFISRLNSLTNTQINVLANQGDAEHSGAEIEIEWYPTERWNLSLDVAYLDASIKASSITSRNIFGASVPIAGRRPYAPMWSAASALQYQFSMLGQYRSRASLFYDYRSRFSGAQLSLVEEGIYKLPGYGLWHANLDIFSKGESWQASVWVKNLADKVYRTRVKSDGLLSFADIYGEPRSVGVSLKYSW